MRAVRLLKAMTASISLCLALLPTTAVNQRVQQRPVLVELFTAAGCSNCPPAERSIEFLHKQQPLTDIEIITLAFHVDYWDTTVWRDPLASPMFTRRQELYGKQFKLDSVYTPQVIVQGKTPVVGVDMNRTISAIHEVSKSAIGKIDAGVVDGMLDIDISNLPPHQIATVYLAAVQDDAPAVSFSGEKRSGNSVVRTLSGIGSIAEHQSELKLKTELPANSEWKPASYVIFVQNNLNRRVLAVKKIPASTTAGHTD